jgi:hypothetical protein
MRFRASAIAALMSSFLAASVAAQTPTQDATPRLVAKEDAVRRWSVHFDDDLFSFANRDRDYTGGVTFGLTGDSAHDHPLSLAGVLERVDRATHFAAWRGEAALEGESLEIGLLLFTPQDFAAAARARVQRVPRRPAPAQRRRVFGARARAAARRPLDRRDDHIPERLRHELHDPASDRGDRARPRRAQLRVEQHRDLA